MVRLMLCGVLLVLPFQSLQTETLKPTTVMAVGPSGGHRVLKGRVRGYEVQEYRIQARAGQTLSVTLKKASHPQLFLNLGLGTSEEAMFNGSLSGNRVVRRLPDDVDYWIRVYLMRAAARRGASGTYALDVAVSGQPLPASETNTDAVVAGARFHALARVSCLIDSVEIATGCEASVLRRTPKGSATVEVRLPGGTRRHILFVEGQPVSSDASEVASALRVQRMGDETRLTIGTTEHYVFPDVFIYGD